MQQFGNHPASLLEKRRSYNSIAYYRIVRYRSSTGESVTCTVQADATAPDRTGFLEHRVSASSRGERSVAASYGLNAVIS